MDGPDSGLRILVIEDDVPTRQLIASVLTDDGLVCDLSAHGPEGIRLSLNSRPSMLLLDMHLPWLESDVLGDAFRTQFGPRFPILAMSASPREAEVAQRFGAYAFLGKPFELDDLVRLVRQGLDLAQRSRDLRRRSARARHRLETVVERQGGAFGDIQECPPR